MIDFIELMIRPFLACLILTSIHAYLGFHVVQRGVIFVDLALAQIAAFGACVAFSLGWGLHSEGSYFCSLGFTLFGALVLTITRLKEQRVPQEALIGIIYAVFAAASVIALNFSPEGGEELKSLLVGHLLFVNWPEIIKVTILYSIVGIIHLIFGKQFFLISRDSNAAKEKGMRIWAWDFLFYVTFGVVVTSSVEMAGVLLVFAFLMVPTVCAILLTDSFKARLVIAWLVGFISSVLGLVCSYHFDLPTGAAVVCVFGIVLMVCFLFQKNSKIETWPQL